MNYQEVVNIIDSKRRFGKACGRDVTKEFMDRLGHPEMGFDIIHIAGTNGKGSVAAFVSSILQAASFASKEKYKVGLFTSPHLIEYTERIQIDGKQISKEDVARIGTMLLDIPMELEPTMFDYWLAMALVYFKEQGVKYLVLETGLGGAKDSTNGLAKDPQVCAITSIGLEHTQYLGNTLAEIAGEKAGIIKPGVPVVIGQMPDEAKEVIIDKCKAVDSKFYLAEPVGENVKLGLFGKYQRNNGGVAKLIAEILQLPGKNQTIELGLAKVTWPGRMQVISRKPFILADGAHNPSGVQALYDSIRDAFPGEKFSFIMAVMADKDYLSMAKIIAPVAQRIYTISLDYVRAQEGHKLAEDLKAIGVDSTYMDSFDEAVKAAGSHEEKIIACGSLYFIGEILNDQNKGRGL
ncbi:MAG: bifunctional folylpolyglutamate synthase/dihydrofolate synthase [Pseudobutyrivibrio sp.]|nr:bifunctional folylpolyglutamate synthase/dihydrofolate synthase [Pseudobutyrivibrio sp.]